jgi:uncharacterized protein YxjI
MMQWIWCFVSAQPYPLQKPLGIHSGVAMLDLQNFLIKEQAGLLKMSDVYDIYNPETGAQVGQAQEVVSGLNKVLRLFISKKLMPTTFECREHPEGALVFYLKKPVALFRAVVEVYDADGKKLGYFKSKMLSLGGGFWVYDNNDQQFAEIKGKWTGWEFKFLSSQGSELGSVTKKWAGALKELFTSADNYVVSISPELADQPIAKILLLSAALAIDAVYYEQGQ